MSAERNAARPRPGRYAYEGLERSLHEKARLGILTSLLARPEGLLFTELRSLCDLTDGNLSRHLQVLHEGGLVALDKRSDQGRPQTRYRLTEAGRYRFLAYLGELERVIRDASSAQAEAARRGQDPEIPGLPDWATS